MGFLIAFCMLSLLTQACSQACDQVIIASNGTISSPLYPANHPANQRCAYAITGPPGSRVTLTFSDLQLHSETLNYCSTNIQVYDGNSSTSPNMGVLCDATAPVLVRSFSNSLFILFVSSVSGPGFLANFTTDIVPQKYQLLAGYAIIRLDIDTSWSYRVPINTPILKPIAVDYDPLSDRVYWTDVEKRTIGSAFLNGTSIQLVRDLGPGAVPEGLAVDHLSSLLFYTDAGNGLIAMQTLTHSTFKVIIDTDIEHPRDIELDKHNGVMYWSDLGATPKIERAGYDGTGRKTLVSASQYLRSPSGLALDTAAGRLYWADSGTGTIAWTSLDGQSTTAIFSQVGSNYFGLDLYKDDLYVTDWKTSGNVTSDMSSSIRRVSTDGSSNNTFLSVVYRLNDVVIVADDILDEGPNGCTVNNGGCSSSDICIPTPSNTNKCLSQETNASETVTALSSSQPASTISPHISTVLETTPAQLTTRQLASATSPHISTVLETTPAQLTTSQLASATSPHICTGGNEKSSSPSRGRFHCQLLGTLLFLQLLHLSGRGAS